MHKNTPQAKRNKQNKIKQTRNNGGNNFSPARKLLRGGKLVILHFLKKLKLS